MTEKLFHTQYLSLAEALYKVAFYILETQQEAEDAVQELYLKLWKNKDVLDGIKNPKAYAMTILRNLCLDRIRQSSRIAEEEPAEQNEGSTDPYRQMDEKERLEKVLAAVKSLPERQREILILRTIQGLSFEEITERTGMNYLTIRVLLSRARQTIRKKT
ncbi:MAG: RNA polymerase sigma factor [Bacteroidales bacterium]|nr:RNA polymerase sigma factor [Bacteroidales bacterium]